MPKRDSALRSINWGHYKPLKQYSKLKINPFSVNPNWWEDYQLVTLYFFFIRTL